MSKKRVEIGQVFQSVGSPNGRTWRVRSTRTLYGILHAELVSTEDEGDAKTLSCLILADTSHYRRIEAQGAAV